MNARAQRPDDRHPARSSGPLHGETQGRRPRLAIAPPAAARSAGLLDDLQRHWGFVGVLVALVASLGYQALSPSSRLAEVERVNARQDSLFAAEAAAQRQTLDTIRRQVGQLLAGQCVKERDRMARLLYDCEER